MVAVALPALLSLAAAYLAEGAKPGMPAGGSEGGLDDADLWIRIDNGGDVLSGMTFQEAANTEPRRVDALIQQRVLKEFYLAIGTAVRGDAAKELMQHAYIARNQALREHGDGRLTAEALAASNEDEWQEYSRLIIAVWVMRQAEAEAIRKAVTDHRNDIYRAFRESAQIARWAAKLAVKDEDKAAWARLCDVFDNMVMFVQRIMENLGQPVEGETGEIPLERLLPSYAVPGAEHGVPGEMHTMPVEDKEKMAGTRGPVDYGDYDYWHQGLYSTDFGSFALSGSMDRGASVGQYRQMGGRYY